MKIRFAALLVALTGCGGGGDVGPPPLQSAEAFCAMFSNNFGNAFACLTPQGNLQKTAFPDGSFGYCMVAQENLGLVGYSVTTFNGGAFFVTSQSSASAFSRELGNQSPGYIRCTRQ